MARLSKKPFHRASVRFRPQGKTMRRMSIVVLSVALLLAACAGLQPRGAAPDWTVHTPAPDSTNTYFVGWASAPGGDEAKASNDAAANLVAGIMNYLGVKITVDSAATARATLDSYSADVRSTVTAQSTGRVSGFAVKDRYVARDRKSGLVVVYVLASYATADLEREKTRIAALFSEREDAVAGPEAEGKALVAQGRYCDAVRKFVEAAAAAAGSDIDNADVKLVRNIENARTALAGLRFANLGNDYRALVGQPFSQPFLIRLVAGAGADAAGVAGANLLVSYQRRQGARTVSKTESAVTDGTGLLAFSPPPPDFVGKARLVVRVDFQSSVDLLDALPAKYEALRSALAGDLAAKYIEIGYEVTSNARIVPTAVVVVDLDDAGKPAGSTVQSGLLEALSRAGFALRQSALDPALVATASDADIVAAAAADKAGGGGVQRLVCGSASITGTRKEGTTFIADAVAKIRAFDLATGALIYQAQRGASGLGSDEASARAAALRELGLNAIGQDLLANLP